MSYDYTFTTDSLVRWQNFRNFAAKNVHQTMNIRFRLLTFLLCLTVIGSTAQRRSTRTTQRKATPQASQTTQSLKAGVTKELAAERSRIISHVNELERKIEKIVRVKKDDNKISRVTIEV